MEQVDQEKLDLIEDYANSLTGGEYDADAEWEAILSHPFGIAIFLGIFAGCLSPCRNLSVRLAEKLRPPLSRSGHPLLWKSLTWIPYLFIMVLAAAAEDVFLDGSNARFAALLVIETVVCSIFVVAQRAVWSALTPPDETSGDPSDDE